MSKRNYYDISALLETKADYLMLLGQRANGKSYQVKKTVIEDAYYEDVKFIYLRRWKADLKQNDVSSYFDDMPIDKLTNGEYQKVRADKGRIYLCALEDGLTVEKREIGRYCALNENERYKSQVFKDYKNIIFEEFITDSTYISDEPRLLQQFISTVARLDKVRVFLIGNTLSRVCPYFTEWCLDNVLRQKQGTIDIYNFHVEKDNSTVKIAVEMCADSKNKNTMFFGQAAKQIISGEWDVHELPKLPRNQYEYDHVYELMLEHLNFKFVLELLIEPNEGGAIVFVYPYTGKKKIQRVLTDKFSDKPYISKKLNTDNRAEALIGKCIANGKICYSDNLTGSDFIKCLDNFHV